MKKRNSRKTAVIAMGVVTALTMTACSMIPSAKASYISMDAAQSKALNIQALGIGAKEFNFGNQILCIGFFFTLFFHKPIEELHGTEILCFVSLTIDIINQRGHIFFVLKTCLQNIHMASCIQIRLVNGFKRYLLVFVLQVLIEKHGVVTLFLSLNFIPVGKAVKPDFLEIV